MRGDRCRLKERPQERIKAERSGEEISHRMWPVARLGGARICPELSAWRGFLSDKILRSTK